MTAPRWIAEALEAVNDANLGPGMGVDMDFGTIATALIERLPLEALAAEVCARINGLPDPGPSWTALTTDLVVLSCVKVLTDGDPEVVELTELYQDACRALDEAGVPYAIDVKVPEHITIEATIGEMEPRKPAEVREVPAHPGSLQMGLADRIRWLAQQRPTRIELQRVEAERDELVKDRLFLVEKRREAETDRDRISAEREQLHKMHEGASDDMDRERTAHQEAEGAAANRELALTVDLDNARRETQALKAAAVERSTALRGLVESDMPAGDLRRALAELIGVDAQARVFAATDRQVLRAKVADQAAYIEALETEIDALEDEIWEDEP